MHHPMYKIRVFVRLAQHPDDIKSLNIANIISLESLLKLSKTLFSKHYNNLDDFDFFLYTHQSKCHGYNVEISSMEDIYPNCIITLVPQVKDVKNSLKAGYDNLQFLDDNPIQLEGDDP